MRVPPSCASGGRAARGPGNPLSHLCPNGVLGWHEPVGLPQVGTGCRRVSIWILSSQTACPLSRGRQHRLPAGRRSPRDRWPRGVDGIAGWALPPLRGVADSPQNSHKSPPSGYAACPTQTALEPCCTLVGLRSPHRVGMRHSTTATGFRSSHGCRTGAGTLVYVLYGQVFRSLTWATKLEPLASRKPEPNGDRTGVQGVGGGTEVRRATRFCQGLPRGRRGVRGAVTRRMLVDVRDLPPQVRCAATFEMMRASL